MRGNVGEDNTDLVLHRAFFGDGDRSAAYCALMREVFEIDGGLLQSIANSDWMPFAYFDTAGRCAASIETAMLHLVADGHDVTATGIRRVAVAPDRRGRGLFPSLMQTALAWCDAQCDGPALLYAEVPGLYVRYGFSRCPQHAFAGPAPLPVAGPAARPLDLANLSDLALLRGCLKNRAPVSHQMAFLGPPSLFLENAAGFELAFMQEQRAVVAYEVDDDGVTIADIAGASIPPLAVILGALGQAPRTVTTLFPPDRLQWSGSAIVDETGLMTRGALPDALAQPFMLPPTSEF